MIAIRFLRIGKKHQPFFRVVVTDKKNPPRGGRFLEIVGFFNPLTKEKKLKGERIKHWLSMGAQPSDRVHNLLVSENIIKEKKIAVHAKTKKKEEESSVPQKEAGQSEAVKKELPAEKPVSEQKEEKTVDNKKQLEEKKEEKKEETKQT